MKIISATAKSKLEADLEELETEKAAIEIRLKEAVGFGDLSENTEYDAERTALMSVSQRIQEIQQILRTAKVRLGYSSTIGPGSLVSIQQLNADGDIVDDLGLLMFDEVGDIMFSGIINPTSALGARIQGNGSGKFVIQDPNGRSLYYKVVLEPESRLGEFLSKFGKSKTDKLAEIYDQVQQ